MLLARGNFCVLFTWRKVTSARRVTRCWTAGNPPLEVAPGQRKTHVNSYRRQTVHRGKVDPGVSELPRGNELSRDHVNRPLVFRESSDIFEKSSYHVLQYYVSYVHIEFFSNFQNGLNLTIFAKIVYKVAKSKIFQIF